MTFKGSLLTSTPRTAFVLQNSDLARRVRRMEVGGVWRGTLKSLVAASGTCPEFLFVG